MVSVWSVTQLHCNHLKWINMSVVVTVLFPSSCPVSIKWRRKKELCIGKIPTRVHAYTHLWIESSRSITQSFLSQCKVNGLSTNPRHKNKLVTWRSYTSCCACVRACVCVWACVRVRVCAWWARRPRGVSWRIDIPPARRPWRRHSIHVPALPAASTTTTTTPSPPQPPPPPPLLHPKVGWLTDVDIVSVDATLSTACEWGKSSHVRVSGVFVCVCAFKETR